ncbi:MAG: type II toxin-antitoxin system HicA family toxin [Defluviitaleaceae bacterium]|nr:type II toxin-antitoxin system HicA family toxin [Defluviitaleaceae bacterium]
MRVPRDADSSQLIKLLQHYGYVVVRQTGSHIRLSKNLPCGSHNITVPDHQPIKIGTLQSIAKDVCKSNGLLVSDFYKQL